MWKTLACAVVAGTLLCTPATGSAASPTRSSEPFTVEGPLASCDGFDVLGSLRGMSTLTERDGMVHVRLRLTGTLQNSVTGLTGRFSEIQVDREIASGTTFSAGLLSKLTVPRRGTAALSAGRGGVTADGQPFITPGAAGVEDHEGFIASVCARLA